ncbi:MAG: MauE/DoxX family redox-associated membrane protein [Actinomycetota bacterium]
MFAYALLLCRFCVATLLLLSALAKWRDRSALREVISDYRLVPHPLIAPAAWLLPRIELTVGLAMATGTLLDIAAAGAAVMGFLFGAAATINLVRGRVIRCGCFGASSTAPVSWATVGRAIAIVAMSSVVALEQGINPVVDANAAPSYSTLAALITSSTLVVAYLLGSEALRAKRLSAHVRTSLLLASSHSVEGAS